MKARWNDTVIAESEGTLEVGGYHYFPRDKVRMDLLSASPKTDADHACPNGVQFYDVSSGAGRSERAAWSYEKPTSDAIRKVDHWVGFWGDVKLDR
ncbi:MAG TPA: DUF427 domain-containing protein [Myxococcaceae bacterium]|nr:DUF427 domain-containing protein [Myxococcaceae bacterium]